MDKKSIIGIVLIAAIFIVWGIINKPNEEQLKKAKIARDSIALIQKKQELEKEIKELEEKQSQVNNQATNDSVKVEQMKHIFGISIFFFVLV